MVPLGVAILLATASVADAKTVDEVIAAAEASNPDLRLAREAVVQAAAGKWQVIALIMPRVNLGANYTLNQDEVKFDPAAGLGGGDGSTLDPAAFAPLLTHPDSPFTAAFLTEALGPAFEDIFAASADGASFDPIVIQPKSSWSGYLQINQPLLSGFAFPAFQSANRVYRAAVQDEHRAHQQVRGGAAKVAYGVMAAREAVGVADDGRTLAAHQLALARAQVGAGLADNRTVLQAQLAVSRAERDWLSANQQRATAELAFAKLTGLPPDTELEPADPIEVPVGATVADALLARSDIAAGELRRGAAQAEATARHLEWLPRVDLAFTEVYNQVPGFVPEHFQWKLGLDFTWSLFDGGTRIANEMAASSRKRSAEIMLEKARIDVADQVTIGWEQFHRAEAAYLAVEDEVELAAENLRLAEAAFSAGSATWLDVDAARLGLQGAKLSRVLERTSRDAAAIDLLVALGRF